MTVLSLFDGMSVAQQALKNLGFEPTYYASEIDPYAIAVTQSNFPNTIQLGSVTDLLSPQLSGIEADLLIGGSPCQDLSIAKKNREGLKGQKSGLFFEYVRIRDEVKPKFFVLENVNSMPKEAKEQISEILGVQPVMINASLVSAQNRKRLFWVGKWNGERYEQVEIPQPEDKGILLRDILQEGAEVDERMVVKGKAFSVTATYNGAVAWNSIERKQRTMVRVGSLNTGGQGDRIYSEEGKSVSLSANGGGRGAKTGLYLMNHKMKDKKQHTEKSPTLLQSHYKEPLTVYTVGVASRTYPRTKTEGAERQKQIEIRDDEKANAMTSVQGDSMVMQDTQIRKLTPIECLRLQSMPDNYFDKAEYKGKPISNTQRYKMCGNAFNQEVVKHILSHLL